MYRILHAIHRDNQGAVAFPLAGKLTDVEKNDAIAFLPHSAEATRAYERATAEFAGSDQLVAVVVYARDTGLTDADKARAAADASAFAAYADGGRVSPPIPSDDGKALLVTFPLAGDEDAQAASIERSKTAWVRAGSPACGPP
jgi:putative drug exporter of the RND superfamily